MINIKKPYFNYITTSANAAVKNFQENNNYNNNMMFALKATLV